MLPIGGSALVLDVGAGGNPYPRSDILLDRLTGSEHRCGESMMIDRPVVFGDASRMPFKDKAFDFVIASHILEHMADPVVFLKELQRVGKAGYIETPNALFERLHPFRIHCLEVLERNGVLHIHKKQQAVEDAFLGTKEMLADTAPWGKFMFESPQMFHVRYFWNHQVKYEIDNPEVSCAWIEEINAHSDAGEVKDSYLTDESGWRAWGLAILNRWHMYQRSRRLMNFDLTSILACPSCGGELRSNQQLLNCQNCFAQYPYLNGIPDFTRNHAATANSTQGMVGATRL
jgi:uncharacterized protein YbaR (Trm112 family)